MATRDTTRLRATIDLDGPGRSIGSVLVAHSDDRHAYATIPLPIAVLAGRPGPTVLICAGTHGDEWEGQLICRRLLTSIDPETVHGRIVMLPALNLPAVRVAARCSPVDGANLNRAFPGDADGDPTAMIADFVERQLLGRCEYALDLHSGGSATEYLPSAFLRIDDDRQRTATKVDGAEVLGLPYTIVVPEFGEHRTMSAAADRQGTVMVATELGGEGRVDLDLLRSAEAGVRRLLTHWGLLPQSSDVAHSSGTASADASAQLQKTRFLAIEADSGTHVLSHGILEPCVGLGERVQTGELVARVHPLEDLHAAPEEVRAPIDGVVAVVRVPPLVEPGDLAVTVCTPVDGAALRASGRLDGREARTP